MQTPQYKKYLEAIAIKKAEKKAKRAKAWKDMWMMYEMAVKANFPT